MSYDRRPRKNGETICLGGSTYRLDRLEGMGGSAIVYRGSYEDALSRGRYHQVLIKELFPWHPQGAVWRDEDGAIRCTEQGRRLMEVSRQRFLQGNEANLELLEQMPSLTSGNLNSYEAYGTYYSVLFVHGGETLEAFQEENRGPHTLFEMVFTLEKILRAVDCFHRKGLLHLDISPDNILLLSDRAMLIDYNSVWNLGQTDAAAFAFSVKEGYSAPELRLACAGEIGYPTDLYSVCAVFFRMLSGRPLTGDDISGNGLRRWLAGEAQHLPVMEDMPLSAVGKTLQILAKGLHVLPRRRYQTAAELQEDLQELTERICRAGISQAALWEAGREECRLRVKWPAEFLARKMRMEGREISLPELGKILEEGACILLEGTGGIGKTWALQKLWEEGTAGYTPDRPAYFYLSLREYQESGEAPDYIRNALLKRLDRPGRDHGKNELDRLLFTRAGGRVRLVLLLDGLNEAGSQRRLLLREIEALGAMPGVAVLLSDRTREAAGYALASFMPAELLALDRGQVEKELERFGAREDEREGLFELLSNPLMLRLYEDIQSMRNRAGEGTREDGAAEKTGGFAGESGTADLIRAYLESFGEAQLAADSGDQALRLCHRYILEHLLTAAAEEMSGRGKTILSSGQMFGIAQKSYQMLRNKSFGCCFQEYLGKSRLMLRGIADAGEWFDFAVNEQLVGRMGLLTRSESGSYSLIHDNFQECLTAAAKKNQTAYHRQQRKTLGLRAAAIAVSCALVVGGGGRLIETRRQKKQESAIQEETSALAAECLKYNFGVLNDQIAAQETLLDIAGEPATLEGDEAGLASYRVTESEILNVEIETEKLEQSVREKLLEMEPEYPVEYLDYICREPVRMRKFMYSAFFCVDRVLKDPHNQYREEDERRKTVEVYDAYLEAYSEYLFYVLDYALLCADPESVAGILDGENMRYPWFFEPYYLRTRISGQSRGEMEQAVAQAKEKLEEAQIAMNEWGYGVNWEMLP